MPGERLLEKKARETTALPRLSPRIQSKGLFKHIPPPPNTHRDPRDRLRALRAPPGAASRRGALPGAGPVRAGGGRAGPGAAVRCGDPSWPRP